MEAKVEEALEKEWDTFLANTDVPSSPMSKIAFRAGFFSGINFSTLTLAEKMRGVMEIVEQSEK